MSGFYSIDPFYTLNSTGQTPEINDNFGMNVAPSGTSMTGGMMLNQLLLGEMAQNPNTNTNTITNTNANTDSDNESIRDGHNFFGPNPRRSPRTSDNMQSFQNRSLGSNSPSNSSNVDHTPAPQLVFSPPRPPSPGTLALYQRARESRLRYEAQNPDASASVQTIRTGSMRTPQDRAKVQQAVDQVLANPFASASMLHEALKALFECLKRNRAGLGKPQSDGTIPRNARLHASDVGAVREQVVQHFLSQTGRTPQSAAAAQDALDRFLS